MNGSAVSQKGVAARQAKKKARQEAAARRVAARWAAPRSSADEEATTSSGTLPALNPTEASMKRSEAGKTGAAARLAKNARQLDAIARLRAASIRQNRLLRCEVASLKVVILQKEEENRRLRCENVETEQRQFDVKTANAIRYAFQFTDRQYSVLRKMGGRTLPPITAVKRWSNGVVDAAELVHYVRDDSVEIAFWARPEFLFRSYLRRMRSAHWHEDMPREIHVVIAGDRGGNSISTWTKIGLFVPDGSLKSKSLANFLTLAAYYGPENTEVIAEAAKPMLEFVNRMSTTGRFESEEISVDVTVLAVADLKLLPMLVGGPHHCASNFCPVCTVSRKSHRTGSACREPRRQLHNPLLVVQPENIIVPPLHTLQGCANTMLKALWTTDETSTRDIFRAAGVKQSHQATSLLSGRECSRFMRHVLFQPHIRIAYRHPKTEAVIELRPVFERLYSLQKWAEATLFREINVAQLHCDIAEFATEWRRAALPSTNKLHLIEAHLADFICTHRAWGHFGEQGLESLHHIANVPAEKSFGINANAQLAFFMKRQLFVNLSDAAEFDVQSRNQADVTPYGDTALVYDDDVEVAEDIEIGFDEVEYFDDV